MDLIENEKPFKRTINPLTGSLESGVTPHRSSHVIYALPKDPSGYSRSLFRSTVVELTRGLSFRILRPSGLSSIRSLKRESVGPAVVSPRAATISIIVFLVSGIVEVKITLTSSPRVG